MKQKGNKKWYDYLWIVSLTYLILGFFNILFAWLGLLCFFIPLIIAVAMGSKSYCNKYCGRGQLFALVGGRFGLSRKKDVPRWLKSRYFRYGFLTFFFAMFFLMLWNTYLVFAGSRDLSAVVTLLWTFKLPWHWAYH
ncbi:MAG: 4Fe-4S binding protein, partial [Lachnospiraceae bacterium]|nr:4Fe-4S binding protein [Lachnospiraceae bacterium]